MFGPRWSLGVGAASGFLAAAIGIHYIVKHRHLNVRFQAGRLQFSVDDVDQRLPEFQLPGFSDHIAPKH
jgi:hypothetical protein